jgi:hypothetical protein
MFVFVDTLIEHMAYCETYMCKVTGNFFNNEQCEMSAFSENWCIENGISLIELQKSPEGLILKTIQICYSTNWLALLTD